MVMSGGVQQVSMGGIANGVTLSSGALQLVWSGGSVSSTSVASSDVQYVESGGSATSTTVATGAYQFAYGTANSTIVTVDALQIVFGGGLASGNSFVVAEKLEAMKIPFVFVTGYGRRVGLPPALSGTPTLPKPCTRDMLEAALRQRARRDQG